MRSGIVILAGMACLLPHAGLALEANEIFKRADPSIVVISVLDKNGKERGLGSGVIVAPRDVVTNCHVVKDAASIAVKQGGVQRSAKLRYQDTARDLCQLQLDDIFPAGRPVASSVLSANLEVGQAVYAIGAPRGLERTISRGIISSLRDMKDNAKLIQTDTSVTHGSSGGGLFDSEARLIGIITFGIDEGNLNFAIPTDWIEQLATRNRDRSADTAATVANANSSGQPAAEKPREPWMPQLGEKWTYSMIHGKRRVGTVTVEITELRYARVRERITSDRSKSFTFERDVDVGFKPVRFQALVVLPGGYQIAEVSPYSEPGSGFAAGQRWSDVSGEYALQGSARKTGLSEMRVVGQERVRVPAGEFNAWKVETSSERMAYNGVFFSMKCMFWYAPEMKRAVRMNIVTESSVAVISNNELYELLAYEPAK